MARGFVSLVGAGPGDPGLLTLRGRRALERADVVLYDRLASRASLLDVDVPGQERIHVGKSALAGLVSQGAINALLVKHAKAGRRVVRLKGGDPFVFGRGGEEAAACVEAGVPFEVVPGVSSIYAVPAYAGIPITDRSRASGFTLLTGHERWDTAARRIDWSRVAGQGGTVVVLMGVLQIAQWTAELIAGGLPGDTPLALVRWGTTPQQETLVTSLAAAADEVAARGIRPPAVAVVGPVVELRESLGWWEQRPLRGRVIAVTRAADDRQAYEDLTDLGALVVHVPLVGQRSLSGGPALRAAMAESPTDLVVTSANAARCLAEALAAEGLDARDFAGVTTWAVGNATAAALRSEVGLGADRVPARASAAGLVEQAASVGVAGRRFLFPAALGARRELEEGLGALGAEVSRVDLYETAAAVDGAARLSTAFELGLDSVALASPSAAEALRVALDVMGPSPKPLRVAAIGPTTAEAARALGFDVGWVAAEHSLGGLVAALAGG